MAFHVALDVYRGPLDLLLYLVRKHEVGITELSLADVTDQFLRHLEVLEQLDVDAVGEFLDVASTLVELKSRMLLPSGSDDEPLLEDPGNDLVARLLDYKRYRDAARMLEDRSREWQQRFGRLASDLPERSVDPGAQPIHEVELWDLVSAFGRVLRENLALQPASIVYDDTPMHVYMQRICERLAGCARLAFSSMFEVGMHKSAMIGVFLAILELVRHQAVRTEQESTHGEIWVLPGDELDRAGDVVRAHATSSAEVVPADGDKGVDP
jgi:segregation and condensation protein A